MRHNIWLVPTVLVLALILSPIAQADASIVYLPITTTPAPIVQWGTVTHIVDGDTLDVALECCECIPTFRVRLLAIDTPERGECYYSEAKAALGAMVDRQLRATVAARLHRVGRVGEWQYGGPGVCADDDCGQGYAVCGRARDAAGRRPGRWAWWVDGVRVVIENVPCRIILGRILPLRGPIAGVIL